MKNEDIGLKPGTYRAEASLDKTVHHVDFPKVSLEIVFGEDDSGDRFVLEGPVAYFAGLVTPPELSIRNVAINIKAKDVLDNLLNDIINRADVDRKDKV